MAVTVTWQDPADASRVVDALLLASAYAAEEGRPILAKRYERQACELGDALDRLPKGERLLRHTSGARLRVPA